MTTLFLLVSEGYRAINYDRRGHAASSQPCMTSTSIPTSAIAETCEQRSNNICLHVWAAPTQRVHYRFTDASHCAAWIDQSFGGMCISVPGWIRLGVAANIGAIRVIAVLPVLCAATAARLWWTSCHRAGRCSCSRQGWCPVRRVPAQWASAVEAQSAGAAAQ